MDHKFTEKLRQWLTTPEDQRDLEQGNLMLLKLSGNTIFYNSVRRAPNKFKGVVAGKLQQYYNYRVRDLTHQQVDEMQRQVDNIVANDIPLAAKADTERRGKRDDHDALPEEIQKKYEENLDILYKMRELHRQLRSLSLENATCPDSERYPFLKELIDLDKKLHKNWEDYDTYVIQ